MLFLATTKGESNRETGMSGSVSGSAVLFARPESGNGERMGIYKKGCATSLETCSRSRVKTRTTSFLLRGMYLRKEMGGLCEFPHFAMLGVSITLERIVSNVWGCGILRNCTLLSNNSHEWHHLLKGPEGL